MGYYVYPIARGNDSIDFVDGIVRFSVILPTTNLRINIEGINYTRLVALRVCTSDIILQLY